MSAARSAIGEFGGALKDQRAGELAGHVGHVMHTEPAA